jgi:cytochrome b involved in lipid metabolism
MTNSKKLIIVLVLIIIAGGGYFFVRKQNTSSGPTPSEQYTLADVATHNKEADCWTTIRGGVYDVTSWINQHPGGKAAILATCGIDATSMFKDQHDGQPEPEQELASLKIGILK